MKPLNKNIREGRKKKGWSQEALARKVGKPRRTVSSHENGVRPEDDLIMVYMQFFGLEEKDFYPFISNENFWKK